VFVFFLKLVALKLAFVTVELVNERFDISDGTVAEELLNWFRDTVAVSLIKEVKRLIVKRF
jgi:hypothetical protein